MTSEISARVCACVCVDLCMCACVVGGIYCICDGSKCAFSLVYEMLTDKNE